MVSDICALSETVQQQRVCTLFSHEKSPSLYLTRDYSTVEVEGRENKQSKSVLQIDLFARVYIINSSNSGTGVLSELNTKTFTP